MSDIAIRVDNLSKLYPELSARARHLGAPSGRHQRPDTLRDALTGFLPRISRIRRIEAEENSLNSRNSRQASPVNSLNSPNSRQASQVNSPNSPNSRQASQVNSPNSPNSWQASQVNSPNSPNSRQASDDLWALKDVSFEVKRGEVVGTPALASGASVPSTRLRTSIGRNGAGTLAPERSAGESTLLKILSRITEPTSGRAETCGGRVGSLLAVGDAAFLLKRWS